MKFWNRNVFGMFIWMLCILMQLSYAITESCYSNLSEVLQCFMQHSDGVYHYEFLADNTNNPDVIIKTYILYSQNWPIQEYENIPATTWRHRLTFYIPKQLSYTKVLLYVTGGLTSEQDGTEKFLASKEKVSCSDIALNNKAIVMELEDVPNQYLFFASVPKKEDQILAYTYKMVMADPWQHAYLAGHLPMAKAIIKAMDAGQEILQQEYNIKLKSYILSGASKRGWAVWLAALEDSRVEAIVPIVIDILNTQQAITHICQSYGGSCPPAFRDYEEEGITAMVNTKAFMELMQIEDPFSYYNSKYKNRLAIPKYIINASGDDFFVPDSSRWYFSRLPGSSNYIRYLPNAMHYFRGNIISDSTNSLAAINKGLDEYFYFILRDIVLPKISWILQPNNIVITSSLKPQQVKLWFCHNQTARDFRFLTSYSVWHFVKKRIAAIFFHNLCDNCYKEQVVSFTCPTERNCEIIVPLPEFKSGWLAAFAELHYKIDNVSFVATTEVNIVPDTMPTFTKEDL